MAFPVPAAGESVATHGRTVTQADILRYAGVGGDFHPAHFDAVRAEGSAYGRPIAQGGLILAIALGLLWQVRRPSLEFDVAMEHLRFPAPVFPGDTLAVQAQQLEVRADADGRTERWQVRCCKQSGETVCAFERTVLVPAKE